MRYLILTILVYICKVYTAISDYEDEKMFFHRKMRIRHAVTLPPCNEDQLMMYLAEIQVINPENIITLSTTHGLKESCNNLKNNLLKIDKYLKSCVPPQQKDLYMQLIRGVHTLDSKLCQGGSFRKHFENSFKCYQSLSKDYGECLGPADWNENSDNTKVCKSYQDIADCYYLKTIKVCGNEAANTLRELILAVINSILTIKCNIRQSAPPPISNSMLDQKGEHKVMVSSAQDNNFLRIYTKLNFIVIILPLYCTLFYHEFNY